MHHAATSNDSEVTQALDLTGKFIYYCIYNADKYIRIFILKLKSTATEPTICFLTEYVET